MASSSGRGARGFSLLEIMVALSILALLMVVAIPSFEGLVRRGEVNSNIRGVVNDVGYARSRAMGGEEVTTGSGVHVRSAGIRFADNRSYQVFINDSNDGTLPTQERIVKVVQIPEHLNLVISQPAVPAEIVFRSNGTLTQGSPNQITLRDTSESRNTSLEISLTGSVKRL